MDDPQATERFVAAADRLVNLLATKPQGSQASIDRHDADVRAAYDEYDAARELLTGERLGQDGTE